MRARRPSTCQICGEPIGPGNEIARMDRPRYQGGYYPNGRLFAYVWAHKECVEGGIWGRWKANEPEWAEDIEEAMETGDWGEEIGF